MAPAKDPPAVEKGKAAAGAAPKKQKAKKGKTSEEDWNILTAYRPAPRLSFFFVFAVICASIVAFYDTCDVRKKKQDCGYSGISPMVCKTTACFTKGGGEMTKKKITLKRSKGTKFGLVSGSNKDARDVFIKSIKEGAIADHNAQAAPEDQIHARDSILSIDGASGAGLRKMLTKSDTEKVIIEIRRSQLPSYLRWIHQSSTPNLIEKMLTAPGFQSMADTFKSLGGLGFALWFVSGYPPASLPFYYFGLSAATAWHLNKCCHNADVAAGVAHCYKGGSANFTVAVNRLQTKGTNLFDKVKKDPRSYAKWLLAPPTELKNWL